MNKDKVLSSLPKGTVDRGESISSVVENADAFSSNYPDQAVSGKPLDISHKCGANDSVEIEPENYSESKSSRKKVGKRNVSRKHKQEDPSVINPILNNRSGKMRGDSSNQNVSPLDVTVTGKERNGPSESSGKGKLKDDCSERPAKGKIRNVSIPAAHPTCDNAGRGRTKRGSLQLAAADEGSGKGKSKTAGSDQTTTSSPCERAGKRKRVQTPAPYQANLDRLFPSIKSVSQTNPKSLLFHKNEFLTVRNPDGNFYVCHTCQNISDSTKCFRLRWLELEKAPNVYKWSFYDSTDRESILTNLRMSRIGKDLFRANSEDIKRSNFVLKKSLLSEKGHDTALFDTADVDIKDADNVPTVKESRRTTAENRLKKQQAASRVQKRKKLFPSKKQHQTTLQVESKSLKLHNIVPQLLNKLETPPNARQRTAVPESQRSAAMSATEAEVVNRSVDDASGVSGRNKRKRGRPKQARGESPPRKFKLESKSKVFPNKSTVESSIKESILPKPIPKWSPEELTCCSCCFRKQLIQSVTSREQDSLIHLAEVYPERIMDWRNVSSAMSCVSYAIKQQRHDEFRILISCLLSYCQDKTTKIPSLTDRLDEFSSQIADNICEFNADSKIVNIYLDYLPEMKHKLLSSVNLALQRGNKLVAVNILKLVADLENPTLKLILDILTKEGDGAPVDPLTNVVTTIVEPLTASPIHYSAIVSDPVLSKLAVNYSHLRDSNGAMLLHYAAVCTSPECLDMLTSMHLAVDIADLNSETPLMWATKAGRTKNVALILRHYSGNVNHRNKHDWTALHMACNNGSNKITQLLLRYRADINAAVDSSGLTPLLLASMKGHLVVVQSLVKQDAKVNQTANNGRNCLHFASLNGHANVVDFLTQPIIGVASSQDADGNLACHLAAQEGWLSCLKLHMLHLDKTYVVEKENNGGHTPLMVAIRSGHNATVEYFLQTCKRELEGLAQKSRLCIAKALCSNCPNLTCLSMLLAVDQDVKLPDQHSHTLFHSLATCSPKYHQLSVKMADRLIELNVDPFLKDDGGLSALYTACASGNVPLIKHLFAKYNKVPEDVSKDDGNNFLHVLGTRTPTEYYKDRSALFTPLVATVADGKPSLTADVLRRMAMARNKAGATPFMHCLLNAPDMVTVIPYIRILVSDLGSNINQTYKEPAGSTGLLVLLARKCPVPILTEFLKLRPDSQPFNQCGDNALVLAVRHPMPKEAVCALLAANTVAKEKHGSKALLEAASLHHIDLVHTLLEAGASPILSDDCGMTVLHHLASHNEPRALNCLQLAANLNSSSLEAKDNLGRRPMHIAVERSPELVPMLIASGASVNQLDNEGRTPLFYAFNKATLDDPTPIVRTLLSHMSKAALHQPTKSGESILEVASAAGSITSCMFLLQSQLQATGRCLEVAIKNGHEPCLALLFQAISKDALEKSPPGTLAIFLMVLERGWIEICHQLLDRVQTVKLIALAKTLRHQHYRLSLRLIQTHKQEGVVSLRVDHNRTLLHVLGLNPPSSLQSLVSTELLRLGVAVDAVDEFGCTVLHYASFTRSGKMLLLICSLQGVVEKLVKLQDRWGRTPLSALLWNCDLGDHDLEIMKTLLLRGADPGKLCHFPGVQGAVRKDPESGLLAATERFVDSGYLEACPKMNCMIRAVHLNHLPSLDLLLTHQPGKVNCMDVEGWTVLAWAIKLDNYRAFQYLVNCKQVTKDLVDSQGNSYCHLAVMTQRYRLNMLRGLVSASFPIVIKNSAGKTPLDLVKNVDATECVRFLERYCQPLLDGG